VQLEFRSTFEHPAEHLWAFHARPGAFSRLAPPWQSLRLVSWTGGIRDGGQLDFDLLSPPPLVLPLLRWTALHEGYIEGEQFCDRQLRGPFAEWFHVHRVEPRGAGVGGLGARSELIDRIEYRPPLGPLGALGDRLKLRADLRRMFAWRHARTAGDLARHARFRERPRQTIAIAGASGLIGSALAAYLSNAGHTVHRLVRRAPRPVVDGSGLEFSWDPRRGEIDLTPLRLADTVIHLGGTHLNARRWSPAFLDEVRQSRVESTALLARTLANLSPAPGKSQRTLLVASGTAGVPESTSPVDEHAPLDDAHPLGAIVRDWEAAADPARAAGLRVAHLRIGFVLAAKGGALATLAPAFKLGLGGRHGTGRQMVSWIGLDDLLGCIDHIVHTPTLSGPVHCVAPEPASNEAFTATLARVLGRPRLLPVPEWLLRLGLGGIAGEALRSTAARPAKLLESGMAYQFPDLEACLKMELGLLRSEPGGR
jgi:uncharacterized protein (TIGR01777 family)